MSKLIDDSYLPVSGRHGMDLTERTAKSRRSDASGSSALYPSFGGIDIVLDEKSFHQMIALERKRTERSRKPFLLMLLDAGMCLPSDRTGSVLERILSALSLSARESDVAGWYRQGSVIGVIFTDLEFEDGNSMLSTMMNRVGETLRNHLSFQRVGVIGISWQLYPEHCDHEISEGNPTFYPDLAHRHRSQRFLLMLKRAIDIVGSAAAILLFSPLFLLAVVLVKATSKGPVIFRQDRLGQFGKTFKLLKFRSMYVNNDHKIHQEFIKRVIKGEHDDKEQDGAAPVYKMTKDPRVTRFGGFLRRTSLDELPQFFNVLKGEMSLVGPRPPLAYEYEEYALWHRRRVLEVKPGITGLWQVRGRSRVRFDDMVRLDLEYVRTWSLWLDIRILMQTPRAVLFGEDAF
jgi:exopolysaccharide biosynthesis polyprenyl glycosylphosphotransferase